MCLRNESPVEEFHDIKCCANNTFVLAKTIGLGDWHVRLPKSMYYSEFAVNLMGGFGEELPGRLLAHDITLTGGIGELVCRIGLTKAKLQRPYQRPQHEVLV